MRSVTIDELLSWAFVHELPKGGGVDGLDNANSAWRMLQASSWGKVTSWAELMTSIDLPARDHDNFLIEQGAPHDDALIVGEAVAELVACDMIIPEGWHPLPDWVLSDPLIAGLASEAIAAAVDRFCLRPPRRRAAHLVSIVIGTAVLGREPAWDAPQPSIRMVEKAGQPAWFISQPKKDVFGREAMIETDGYDKKAGRPRPGAYRRYEFSTSPVGDIMARLDRELWGVALGLLERVLANRLTGHRFMPSGIETRPWKGRGPAIKLLPGKGEALKMSA